MSDLHDKLCSLIDMRTGLTGGMVTEFADEILALFPTDMGLLADAMKLLDVPGMWKAPVDEQWRESYVDLRKRYEEAKHE